MDTDVELSAVLADVDQAWASARLIAADLERIVKHGPNGSSRDDKIVRIAAQMVAMELELREERWGDSNAEGK